jgi:very-short-patch-repair endonuclease
MEPEIHIKTGAEPVVLIEATFAPSLNLAFYQNSLPVLREMVVVNNGDRSIEDVRLTISSTPPFVSVKRWHIEAIGAHQRYHLSDLDVTLDGATLNRLTEAETAQVGILLTVGGEEIARIDKSIELLARNQWGGIGNIPEIVAAFVEPNDPAVERLLKKSADILRQHGKSSALNGYEGGPKRVWELVSAIWTATGAMGLDYALPPASFEHTGQKVRSPGQISDSGLATCLDTTLFFCAALEQCGLNPLVVFTQSHAFAGVWLKAEEFSTAVVDDVTALRKRIKLNELVLFETTLVTQRPCPGFGRAAELGAQRISEAQEQTFELAVDVRRARLQRIKPLASAEVTHTAESVVAMQDLEPIFEEAPDLSDDEIGIAGAPEPSKIEDRLARWQRKLLDLSLRNNLLNFRVTKKVIPLDAPDPGFLEDVLAGGQALKLLPRPDLMDGNDPRSRVIHEARTNEDLRRAHALDALQRNEVFVGIPLNELETRLVELYRSARVALQEGGANTLFLAIGFLSWTRDDKNDKRFRAPLVLVPVTLQRKSVRSGFTLELHEDEPRFNPTLLEMLRQDFGLSIPIVAGELPKDQSGLDITGIWKVVAREIKDIKGWEVIEEVVLGTFSFAKYLMWKDLVDRVDALKKNPVVRHLVETPRDGYPSHILFPNPRELDVTYGPEQTFCPLPTDSSQMAAVMAAVSGKDFVLIGPPGTGKSQTISNLIAQCLAGRKTVLFVSEKIAALDVVYRRLRDVGLGDFCLELHSNKARKLEVLDQLRTAWDAHGAVDADEWLKEALRLKLLRNQLNEFVDHLHHKHRNGLTPFQAIGLVLKGAEIPPLDLAWPSVAEHDADTLDALREVAERLDINAREVGNITNSVLASITHADWSPNWQQSFIRAVQSLVSSASTLESTAMVFFQATQLPVLPLTRKVRDGLTALAHALPMAAGHDWRFTLRADAPSVSERMRHGLSLLRRHSELLSQISKPFSEDVIHGLKNGIDLLSRYREIVNQLSVTYNSQVFDLDAGKLQADWKKAKESLWPLNWLRQRRIQAALTVLVNGSPEPNFAADIDCLAQLQLLASDIDGLRFLRDRTDGLWAGLQTWTTDVGACLDFQAALSNALAGNIWREGENFSVIASGRCGAGMAADLERLRELQELQRQVLELRKLQGETAGLWAGLGSVPDEIQKALAFHDMLSHSFTGLANSAEAVTAIKAALGHLLGDGNMLLSPKGPVETVGKDYVQALAHYVEAVERFTSLCGGNADSSPLEDIPADLLQRGHEILSLESKLRAWCAWTKVCSEATGLGLAPLVKGIKEGGAVQGRIRDAFDANYCRWWINAVVDSDDILRNFVSAEHEKHISDFRVLDDHFTELTRAYIRVVLCRDMPDQDNVQKNSEWGILRHEMQKKKRHMPLRELINHLPNTITKLTPCLLMSPLSVAQYLSPDTAIFDLVVFDEASQITTWDAIGAIARGKQVVMVGDPKQLPPTSFFDRAESDLDDEDLEGDLESILDECIGANLPTINLSWHYRSRHESLIAFSNHRYYEGGLVTFPSPVTEDRAVNFHRVGDGIYEKGGARTNKPEARALVFDLVSRLKDPQFKDARFTIGVVTFNTEQQRLIEDLLDDERRKDPSIEPYFAEDTSESVFVKNIESVQGDERDIIYFSITYGPDLSGAVSMNFGPMNRNGGERRLNVAITRARQELRIFSSLRPEQIDLSRTNAIGVRDLKHFLEFAERGPRALAEATFGSIGSFESPFEKAVADALNRKGWQVHPQVGVSSFRIDLGIVDPDAPGQYLAGIECDGATYHRSATARDRDKLREQVLRGLGWDILRIWSTDWWINTQGAIEKVHSQLVALLEANRTRRQTSDSLKQEVLEIESPVEPIPEQESPEYPSHLHNVVKLETSMRQADASITSDLCVAARKIYAKNADELTPTTKNINFFQVSDLSSLFSRVDAKKFYEPDYNPILEEMIAQVISAEGPVREDVLARRIARAHDWARTGARIQSRIKELAKKHYPTTKEGIGLFFWPIGSNLATFPVFRRPFGQNVRPVDEIALPEIIALAREISVQGMEGENAISAMARVAGLQKLHTSSRHRIKKAWSESKMHD